MSQVKTHFDMSDLKWQFEDWANLMKHPKLFTIDGDDNIWMLKHTGINIEITREHTSTLIPAIINNIGILIINPNMSTFTQQVIMELVKEYNDNLYEAMAIFARKTLTCACCQNPLAKLQAIEYGYGYSCASKYELPWTVKAWRETKQRQLFETGD